MRENKKLSERLEVSRGRYATTEEIMALYHVCRKTVYRWNDAGKLHGIKAGRRLMFDRAEVESLVSDGGSKSANCE